MKIISKIILFVLLCNFSNANSQFVKNHGQLKVQGTQLVDKFGKPVVLRGLSYGWHSFWPRFYNQKSVAWLKKDFNCNVVRAAMGIEVGESTYVKDSVFAIKKIRAVVDGAIKSDIYVIIDWHSHNINLKESKLFFDKISLPTDKTKNLPIRHLQLL